MCAPGQEGRGPFGSRDRDSLGDVKTYIHVGHGLIEYTVVTKFAKAVLLGRVVLVGLQKVFKDSLFLHGLTDALHPFQGDPVEGCVLGSGPAFFFFLNFLLPYLSLCLLAPPVCLVSASLPPRMPTEPLSLPLILDFFLAFSPSSLSSHFLPRSNYSLMLVSRFRY